MKPSSRKLAACAVAMSFASIAAAACGDDSGGPAAGADGGGVDGSSLDGGGGGSSTSSGGSSGHPITLPTACTTPTTTSTVVVSDAGTAGVRSAAVAWSGTEAAVAYVEKTAASGAGSVFFQRMDHAGKPLAEPIVLAKDKAPANVPLVGLASDGASFVSCWEETASTVSTSCASVPVGGGAAKAGYTQDGVAPFGVASDGVGARLLTQNPSSSPTSVVQQLDTNAAGTGSISIGAQLLRVLAARPAAFGGGYVVADAEGGHDVYWQDLPPPGGSPNAGTLQAGAFVSGLAVNDKARVALVAGLGDKTLYVVPLATGATAVPVETSFGNVAAIATGAAGFGAVWSQATGAVRYQSVSATGAPVGSSVDLQLKTLGVLALTAVDDGFLLLTTTAEGSADPKLVATHLGCPP